MADRITMRELARELANDKEYVCSKQLFSLVNRALNAQGYQASVTGVLADGAVFKVIKMEG